MPDMIDNLTQLVLVNAIYFKAYWAFKFKKIKTRSEIFYQMNGTPKIVSMMTQTNHFELADISKYNIKIIRLPYVGGRVVMDILLPNENIPINKNRIPRKSRTFPKTLRRDSSKKMKKKDRRFRPSRHRIEYRTPPPPTPALEKFQDKLFGDMTISVKRLFEENKQRTKVVLSLPKFKLESVIPLHTGEVPL